MATSLTSLTSAYPLRQLERRSHEDWLIGVDQSQLGELVQHRYALLRQFSHPVTLLLAHRDPIEFLAGFLAAVAANCPVFLGNPDWGVREWQQVLAQVHPDLMWGHDIAPSEWSRKPGAFNVQEWAAQVQLKTQDSLIFIPTGGSSGTVRFTIHTWQTLMASIQGFRAYFQVDRVHSFCVLPLYHVSGLMQFLRSFISGGNLVILPFRAMATSGFSPTNIAPTLDLSDFFLSLVPTQLHRLLNCDRAGSVADSVAGSSPAVSWLSQFYTVLLGGAPAWTALLEQARQSRIRLAPTYGMTETASQVATLKPDDFLNGITNAGQVLPHAQITIQNPAGETLACNQPGKITIQASSLALGYYPERWCDRTAFQPDDLGFLDEQGYLHVVGRNSDKIITGGENVFPAEVEAVIQATGLVVDVCVIGVPDLEWGQAVTALYSPIHAGITVSELQRAIAQSLSPCKRPKHWLAIAPLPRNLQGKVDRETLKQWAQQQLGHSL